MWHVCGGKWPAYKSTGVGKTVTPKAKYVEGDYYIASLLSSVTKLKWYLVTNWQF